MGLQCINKKLHSLCQGEMTCSPGGKLLSKGREDRLFVERRSVTPRITAVIVMPKTTPDIKVDAVRSRGAEVMLHGNSYDDAYDHAQDLAKKRKLVFVHPYDDLVTMGGCAHDRKLMGCAP